MKGAPKERDSNFEGDYIAVSQGTAWIPTHQQVSGGPEDLPSTTILSRNPTPERTSPHSRHGECIGMRSSKSKTSNSYPPYPKRDVAGSRRSSPFTANFYQVSLVSTMRGGNTWKITRANATNENSNSKSAASQLWFPKFTRDFGL